VYTKHLDAVATEWTGLHVAFLVKKFDQELNEFMATEGTVLVTEEEVSFHIAMSPTAERARAPSRVMGEAEEVADSSEKLLSA